MEWASPIVEGASHKKMVTKSLQRQYGSILTRNHSTQDIGAPLGVVAHRIDLLDKVD